MAFFIGLEYSLPDSFKESFMKWYFFFKLKKIKNGKEGIVWLAVVWTL